MSALATAERLFFWLMLYSVGGWVYETVLCSLQAKKFVNRGFLNGPYCPIYGFGAVLDVVALGRISNIPLLFVLGALLDCTLEYLTSFAMEKLFHMRWWDYSKQKWNLHGRVCALGAVVFGAFSVVTVRFLHPALAAFTDKIPSLALHITCGVLLAGVLADLTVTVAGFVHFNDLLRRLSAAAEELETKIAQRLHEPTAREHLFERFSKQLNLQQRRLLAAFPKLQSVHYKDTLATFKRHLDEAKTRKKH